MKKFSFSYRERLHSQKDFNKVFRNAIKLENKAVKILAYKRNDEDIRRLGLITSRKIGHAFARNRIKRRLREIFRTSKHSLAHGLDIIFISKPYGVSLDYNSLKKNVLDLLKKANLYNENKLQ